MVDSKIGPDTKRVCRCGAGTEKTPGKADTPGFELNESDIIEEETFKGVKILRLKRNERRMKQTSFIQLQSWRANCDVAVLIYSSDPAHIDHNDIANVSGYVVSYCTKGNLSYTTEKEALSTIVMAADDTFAEGQEMNTITLARKILNSFHSKRVISKAEVSCDLLDLDLYRCTEMFVKVPLSNYMKIVTGKVRGEDQKKGQLNKYANRNMLRYGTYSFEQYFYECLSGNERRNESSKDSILTCYGINGAPCFPPSIGYAKKTLILHKPWSVETRLDFEKKGRQRPNILDEFKEFIQSNNCPSKVKLIHHIAHENYKRRNVKRQAHCQYDPFVNGDGIDEATEDLINACRLYKNYELTAKMDKGLHYDWNKTQYDKIDPTFVDGVDWLTKTRDEYRDRHGTAKFIPKKNGTPYSIEHIKRDEQQSRLVYAVINKVKEWVEFPQKHSQNPEVRMKL